MMMIKDNHIDFAGGIEAAIEKANAYQKEQGLNIPIEIEARNLQEIDEILSIGKVQRIMLDNFSYEDTRLAVARIDKRYETESSVALPKTLLGSMPCVVSILFQWVL